MLSVENKENMDLKHTKYITLHPPQLLKDALFFMEV